MQSLTFLMPLSKSASATKTFILNRGGEWSLSASYKAGKYFKGFEISVTNLEEVFDILEENQNHPVFFIHGGIIEGTDIERMVRRKRSDHKDKKLPTIRDREVRVFCFDIDGYIDRSNPENDIDKFIHKELPPQFHTADYIYQYSASYGLTTNKLKCHLFFWLKTPTHNVDIGNWIINYNKVKDWGNIVDAAVLRAAQPVYTQRRICKGGVDPVDDFIGYVKKEGELDYDFSDIVVDYGNNDSSLGNSDSSRNNNTVVNKGGSKYDLSSGVEKILTSENYHDELNRLALSLLNRRVPANTVRQMLEGAMKAAKRSIDDPTRLEEWQTRFDDIGRSVNSASSIVDNPTIEEILLWIEESTEEEVIGGFADKCLKLPPLETTMAIERISDKVGIGKGAIKKTIKLAKEEEQEKIVQAAKEAKSAERESRGIHEIEVHVSNHGDIAKRVGNVLACSKKYPHVFRMGGSLASVDIGHPKTIRQCAKYNEMGEDYPQVPIIRHYRKPFYSLACRVEKDVVFLNSKGKDTEIPIKSLYVLGESRNKRFKSLTGIVEHPFIDSNWNLVQKDGYNEKTGLYTMLHRKLKIKRMKAKEAYNYLAYELFDEFPFNSDLDRAIAVSALLTAVQRPTIAGDGGMPGFGIISPVQSSGKTTLAQLISYAIYNRPVAASSWSNDEEELGKHLLAILQEGHSCVLFDNIKRGASIQSGRLSNAMSNDIFGGRQLGENRTIEVPSSVIWLFTGNGIQFIGDFATRVYPINLNPKMANPNIRKFKRDNVGDWAMENRKRILSAVLSIIISGRNTKIENSTRFKGWDRFVRGAIINACGIDVNDAVCDNQLNDPHNAARYQILKELKIIFKDEQFTTRGVIKKAFDNFQGGECDLGIALKDLLDKKAQNSVSVGRLLSSMTDAVVNDLVLTKRTTNVVQWKIIDYDANMKGE